MLVEKLYFQGPEYADAWNFGPAEDDARTVSWLAEHIAALWGPEVRWEEGKSPPTARNPLLKIG